MSKSVIGVRMHTKQDAVQVERPACSRWLLWNIIFSLNLMLRFERMWFILTHVTHFVCSHWTNRATVSMLVNLLFFELCRLKLWRHIVLFRERTGIWRNVNFTFLKFRRILTELDVWPIPGLGVINLIPTCVSVAALNLFYISCVL